MLQRETLSTAVLDCGFFRMHRPAIPLVFDAVVEPHAKHSASPINHYGPMPMVHIASVCHGACDFQKAHVL
jgi:hypothetical protein